MKNGDIVLNLKTKRFDLYRRSEVSSGFTMHRVGEDLLYSGEFTDVDGKYSNSEIWRKVESFSLPVGLRISNQLGKSYVFDGESFNSINDNDYAACCPFKRNDVWTIDDIL